MTVDSNNRSMTVAIFSAAIIQRNKRMQMIRHNHISTHPSPMLRPTRRKLNQPFMHTRLGQNLPPLIRASRDEINRRAFKEPLQSSQTFNHAPPPVAAVYDRRKLVAVAALYERRSLATSCV